MIHSSRRCHGKGARKVLPTFVFVFIDVACLPDLVQNAPHHCLHDKKITPCVHTSKQNVSADDVHGTWLTHCAEVNCLSRVLGKAVLSSPHALHLLS